MTQRLEKTEDNRTLLNRAKEGDYTAKQSLVEQNTGLVWSIVHRFTGRGVEKEDLFQIGCIGLLKAIDRFDDTYDVCFSTYAVPMIMGEIRKFLRDDGPIKVSRSLKEISARAYGAKAKLEHTLGRSPTVSELADEMCIELDKLLLALESCAAPESLYQTAGTESDKLVIDSLCDGSEDEEKRLLYIMLKQALEKLSGRDKNIIIMRYFRHKTQTQVADMLGISQVQVSRLEKKLLSRLKEELTG